MAEPFLGEIKMIGFGFAPRGWTTCDGQIMPISQNTALFSLLGTTFGGDGRTTFGLPDLRGRNPVHVGTGPGLPRLSWGQRGGSHTVPIAVSNMPSHGHTFAQPVSSLPADHDDPDNSVPAATQEAAYTLGAATGSMTGGTTGFAGGSSPLNVTEPFLGIWHVIALVGIFPSRN